MSFKLQYTIVNQKVDEQHLRVVAILLKIQAIYTLVTAVKCESRHFSLSYGDRLPNF